MEVDVGGGGGTMRWKERQVHEGNGKEFMH